MRESPTLRTGPLRGNQLKEALVRCPRPFRVLQMDGMSSRTSKLRGARVWSFSLVLFFSQSGVDTFISSNPHGRILMGTSVAPKSQLAGLYTPVRN